MKKAFRSRLIPAAISAAVGLSAAAAWAPLAAQSVTPTAAPTPARRGTSPGLPEARLDYRPGQPPPFWSVATAETIMARYPDYRDAYWKPWSYVQGFMFVGFEELYSATGDKRYLDYMRRYIDHFVDERGDFHGDKLTNLDNLMTGTTIAALYEHTGDERYKKAAARFRQAFDTYPRSDGQFWHGQGAPNMWIDGVFMGQMFLLRHARSVGDAGYCQAEAVRQITTHERHCRKGDTGLLLHAWSEKPEATAWADPRTGLSPEVWSEGLGWYALVVPEALAVLPGDHPGRPAVEAIFRRLAAGLQKAQDAKTGGWFMIVDKGGQPDNWIDPSGTAMFVYALGRGIELGLLDEQVYRPVVERGYRSLLSFAVINERGLVDVSGGGDGISVKKDYAAYVGVKRVLNAKEAVGAFLWASAFMEKEKLRRGSRQQRAPAR
jgi:unsaturated rhamnogalacturonyl hydrolase